MTSQSPQRPVHHSKAHVLKFRVVYLVPRFSDSRPPCEWSTWRSDGLLNHKKKQKKMVFEVGQIALICTWWTPRVPPIGLEHPHWRPHSSVVWLSQSQAIQGESAVQVRGARLGFQPGFRPKYAGDELAFFGADGPTDGSIWRYEGLG